MVKNPPASAGDAGLIPGSGKSPGEGNGNPFQHSCLRNPMDRGACQAIDHVITNSQTWMNMYALQSVHLPTSGRAGKQEGPWWKLDLQNLPCRRDKYVCSLQTCCLPKERQKQATYVRFLLSNSLAGKSFRSMRRVNEGTENGQELSSVPAPSHGTSGVEGDGNKGCSVLQISSHLLPFWFHWFTGKAWITLLFS